MMKAHLETEPSKRRLVKTKRRKASYKRKSPKKKDSFEQPHHLYRTCRCTSLQRYAKDTIHRPLNYIENQMPLSPFEESRQVAHEFLTTPRTISNNGNYFRLDTEQSMNHSFYNEPTNHVMSESCRRSSTQTQHAHLRLPKISTQLTDQLNDVDNLSQSQQSSIQQSSHFKTVDNSQRIRINFHDNLYRMLYSSNQSRRCNRIQIRDEHSLQTNRISTEVS